MNPYYTPGILKPHNRPDQIISAVCNVFDSSFEKINVRSRKRNLVIQRQIIMALANKLAGRTLHESGLLFRRDHATVIYAIKAVKNDYDTDPDYRRRMWDILRIMHVDVRFVEKYFD